MSLKISEPAVHNWKAQKICHDFGTISSSGSALTDSEVRTAEQASRQSLKFTFFSFRTLAAALKLFMQISF